MALYKAPLADIDFLLNEFLDKNLISEIESHKDFDQDFIKSILEEGAKICEEKIHPLNKMGDREGCLFQNGTVSTPKGFKDLYDFYNTLRLYHQPFLQQPRSQSGPPDDTFHE